MRNSVGAAISFLLLTNPSAALAQPPGPPAVEVGVQVSRKIAEPAVVPVSWSPRVTLNLTHLTAIEVTADIQNAFMEEFEGSPRTSARGFSAHWRQTLFTSGRWQVFGVLGAGMNRVEQNYPERIFQGRDGPEVMPAFTFVDSEPVVHLGPGVQVEVAPWLALRGDVRLTVGDNNGGVRGMVGAVIPLGRFRAGDRPTGAALPLAAWSRVKPGREVWVTTVDGAMVHGEVSSVSNNSLRVRKRNDDVTVSLADVRLIEGRDSLKNGMIIGGLTGAASGAALLAWAASVFCETDSCDQIEVVAIAMGAAGGALIGGLTGAMVDGLIPGRQTLFEKTGLRVIPVLSPNTKAVRLTIGWR